MQRQSSIAPADPEPGDASARAYAHLDQIGQAALYVLLQFGLPANTSAILNRDSAPGEAPVLQLQELLAQEEGLEVTAVEAVPRRAPRQKTVFITRLRDRSIVIVEHVSRDTLRAFFPLSGFERRCSLRELAAEAGGAIIEVTRRVANAPENRRFGSAGWSFLLTSALKDRTAVGSALLASFVLQLIAISTPLLFQTVVDKVLAHSDWATLWAVTVTLVVLAIFEASVQWLRELIIGNVSSQIDSELGDYFMRHLIRLRFPYFQTQSTGLLMTRLREVESIRTFLMGPGLQAINDAIFLPLVILVLVLLSPALAWVILIAVPVMLVPVIVMRSAVARRVLARFRAYAAQQQYTVELLSGYPTVKALAIEKPMVDRWVDKFRAYVGASLDMAIATATGKSLVQLTTRLTTAAVLFVGAELVLTGRLTVGQLIAFNMIAAQVYSPVLRLASTWQDLQQVSLSVDRISDVLEEPPEASTGLPMRQGANSGTISYRDISFRYPDGPNIISGLSLDIPAGQIIGIVGPSGSGKSTLAKLLLRFVDPDIGTILLDGDPIHAISPRAIRRRIGIVLQENAFFEGTIAENIALSKPGAARREVQAAARAAGASEFIDELPRRFDSLVRERGENLSGGQRQRLAIARAILADPRILVLDEATSALDYESERAVQENMRTLTQGKTVIIIAHRLAALRFCDRIICLRRGRIVEDGAPQQLVNDPTSFFAELWATQAGPAGKPVVDIGS